ncbi:hypothetical protein ACF0H5_002776 [Mactra antiquata]
MASDDGLYKKDHPYFKFLERTPGFQTINVEYRNEPEHSYSRRCTITPVRAVKRKRADFTPPGMSPEQPKKMLDETVKRPSWTKDEMDMLAKLSKQERTVGESQTSFWDRCAEELNKKYGDKKRTGHSCKNASRRLCLQNTFDSLNSVSSVDKMQSSKDACTQTDWSIPVTQSESGPKEGEWIFIEPKRVLKVDK